VQNPDEISTSLRQFTWIRVKTWKKGERMKTICLIGAFDTKGSEYAFMRKKILARGHEVLTVNTGVLGSTDLFPVTIEADRVADAGGASIDQLRKKKDRGEAIKIMCAGASETIKSLYEDGKIDGIIGMGGTGGTTVVTSAMQVLPIGMPKICVSTAASGDVRAYVGTNDITMIPSIVDVAGINRISRIIFSRAAGAICGMVEADVPESEPEKPVIAASMFGNTTECVNACMDELSAKGYEVLVFHATGTGGKTMERLVKEGLVEAVLDITTTEWADTVCGGVFDAGPERLDGPGQMGIPHLIVPGCVDMANFGSVDTVPEKYKNAKRMFYMWNPSVTLMRTNKEENEEMGKVFAQKANAAEGPVAILIPLRGVSILDSEGGQFCDWETDKVMFDTIKSHVREGIPVVEMDNNINDPQFSAKAVSMMLELIERAKKKRKI
jgi:uncharacterized protein (UPF0261 family)